MVEDDGLRRQAVELLRQLVLCDTSNPPGDEAQAAAVLEEYLGAAGIACERVAKEPSRPNLVARLPGNGDGPSLAFLGHLDVVPARREHWSVDPFAAVERDGAVWGRGTVDMKSQVAATAVALATLARDGYRPAGDMMLILTADEEVGDAGVGAPYLVEQRPDIAPDYVVGEGAGERYETALGPLYLLDRGVKAGAVAKVTVRGRAGDSSLPGTGENALAEAARLVAQIERHRADVEVQPELAPLLDLLAPPGDDDARVAAARGAHPGLDHVVDALTRTVVRPTRVEAQQLPNIVADEVTLEIQCSVLPGTTSPQLEGELRRALGPGDYGLDVAEPLGGSTSPVDTPLQRAIEAFLREHDPDAALVPALGYGYSDCHVMREAYGSVAYGFIPFRHGDPLVNLMTKHGADERVLVDDLVFQVRAALFVARELTAATSRP